MALIFSSISTCGRNQRIGQLVDKEDSSKGNYCLVAFNEIALADWREFAVKRIRDKASVNLDGEVTSRKSYYCPGNVVAQYLGEKPLGVSNQIQVKVPALVPDTNSDCPPDIDWTK